MTTLLTIAALALVLWLLLRSLSAVVLALASVGAAVAAGQTSADREARDRAEYSGWTKPLHGRL